MAMKINLNEWKSKPHPIKAEVQKHGVTYDMLKNYLGLRHQTYVAGMLNGTCALPKKHEQKIKEMLAGLEAQLEE